MPPRANCPRRHFYAFKTRNIAPFCAGSFNIYCAIRIVYKILFFSAHARRMIAYNHAAGANKNVKNFR